MLSVVGGKWVLVLLMGAMVSVTGFYVGEIAHQNFAQINENTQAKVLFDFTKEEDAGNADWTINGAYSDYANALKNAGFSVGEIGNGHGTITSSELAGCKVLIIPEPQDTFSSSEKNAILNFVKNGGALIYISDHHGSDRNNNGHSSWELWNSNLNFDSVFGITLLTKEAGVSSNKVTDIVNVPGLTDGVSEFGLWAGTTMQVSGNASAVAYQTISGSKYAVMAYSTYGTGKVIVFGDSSTFDDGSADSNNHGDHIYNGWAKYDDATLGVNMVKWAAVSENAPSPPSQPSSVTLSATAGDGYVKLTWSASGAATTNSSWKYATSAPFYGGYGEAVGWDGQYIYLLRQKDKDATPQFYRYDPATGNWKDLSAGLPNAPFENGVAIAYDYSGHLYVLSGGSYRSNGDRVYFFKYTISTNTWSRLKDAPHIEGPGDAIVYSGYDHKIYAFLGRAHYLGSYSPSTFSSFARYDPATNTWENLSFPSWWPDGGTDDGASLAWTGGHYIYGLEGEFYENSPLRGFARYDITNNTWVKMADIPTQDGVGDGGSLIWLGHYYPELSNVIFALDGNGCNETPGYNFSEYHILTNTWTHLPSMPYPVGDFVGNRLGFADGKIFYWQGTPDTWAGGGKRMYYYDIEQSQSNSSVSKYKIYRGTSSGGETFLAEVSGSTLSYKDTSVTNGITYYYYVTAVNSAGESAPSNEVSATPHASTPTKKILFVDDDAGKSYETYFTKALGAAGFSYDTWDTSSQGTPSASKLEGYKVVIWNIGAAWENTLTSSEQSALETYLNNGGKLYLSSQDLLWDLSGGNDGSVSNTFVNNYLGVSGVKNDVSYTSVSGVGGDPITGSMGTVSLSYPFKNYADELSVGSAQAIFTDSNGKATAVRYDSGTYRMVFTAFSFEAVENANANTGAQLMKNIINWLLNGGSNTGTTPSAPLNLKAVGGDGYVELSWSAPSSNGGASIKEYKIYRGTSSGGESYLVHISGSRLSYNDTGVKNGVTYYYYITAVNSVGEGAKSNEAKATPQATTTHSNKILFVDDDSGSAYSEYIVQALNNSQILSKYDVYIWDVYQIGRTPTFSDMKEYGIVIWSTGYAYQYTLTSADQQNLMEYLNNSGRLYLSSQDLLWDITDGTDGPISNTFVNDYLGISAVKNDVSYTKVYGVSGNAISGEFGPIYFNYPYHNYADTISLESGAQVVFEDSYGDIAGASYTNGNYKVVFTAFSFEAVEHYDSYDGATLMYNIINWLAS